MVISLNEFYACICIIFVLALYSVPPLLLNPALSGYERIKVLAEQTGGAVFSALAGGRYSTSGFAPIFPDTCYHLTHYWPAAADIPVASDNPVHYADAIRYNARTPLQGSLLPLTRLV